jgi:ankyrin repeat protein
MDHVSDFFDHVASGRVDEVRAVLAASPALVNAVGPHPYWGGRPQPLHLAIEAKRQEMFALLLDSGADVNGRNDEYDHWSPLMIALNGSDAMRDELLRRGARIGLVEALMMADDGKVKAFLEDGALPTITPNGGSLLAFARTPYAIDRLMELGASITQKDRWGATPIDAISRLGPKGAGLVAHLTARGVPATAKEYARLGDQATLASLIDQDPGVARQDGVLMAAVDFRHHTLVEWLLAHGASVNARADAQSRHTALHSAAWNGDLEMVKLLVAAGADTAALDDQYKGTPRGWAATSIEISHNPACHGVVAFFASRGDPA